MGWAERHPRKARTLMKFYGMRDELDVLKCPRCGRVIKEAGVPVDGRHFAILTLHMGSAKCAPLENRPLCRCGCGTPVNWDPARGRWRDYVFHHRSREFRERMKERFRERSMEKCRRLYESIKALLPCPQPQLQEKTGLNKRSLSQKMRKLEEHGLIEREKTLYRSRWTYMIKEKAQQK